MPNLLFEIYTEEIPASYIEPALEQMKEMLRQIGEAFSFVPNNIEAYATPRRLVLWATDFPERQLDKTVEVSGPSESACYKDGQPTKALEGFARKQGVAVEDVKFAGPEGNRKCVVKKIEKGRTCAEFLAVTLPQIISKISFPKSMRWIPGNPATFARPVRSILAILDSEVVAFEWNGIKSGKTTFGHPFLSPESFKVLRADLGVFEKSLKERFVILDPAKRAGIIEKALVASGQNLLEHIALVDEVKYLLEWPEPAVGEYDERFLNVPACVVKAAMTEHQRYFPISGSDGKLKNKFICITNRLSKDGAVIKRGNERVLRARLDDAEFFFKKDMQISMEKFSEIIDKVVYHKDLGTYGEKTERMEQIGLYIAECFKLSDEDKKNISRAAKLCKADLATEIVGEFPSLQGEIGKEYAKINNEHNEVSSAIEEHYLPSGKSEQLPYTKTGIILSLADKFDNLVGFFATGHKPSGAGDPFGLRRSAIGMLSILMILIKTRKYFNIPLALEETINVYIEQNDEKHGMFGEEDALKKEIIEFMKDRFRVMCKSNKQVTLSKFGMLESIITLSFEQDMVEAVLATKFDDICETIQRLESLNKMKNDSKSWDSQLRDYKLWDSLVEIVQRTFNIAKKDPGNVKPEFLKEDPEINLYKLLKEIETGFHSHINAHEYIEAAKLYHDTLKVPVHEFFDKVFVNVEDKDLRRNRIALSWAVNRLFVENIADLKLIVMPGAGA